MRHVKYLIMDVDGTLTDGRINIGKSGELFKSFSVKDGLGIKRLKEREIKSVIITGRSSSIVERRSKELNIDFVFQGVQDKLLVLNEFLNQEASVYDDIACIGDDINDLEILNKSKISGCPLDAIDTVKKNVDFISSKNGGDGAVRDFIEYFLKLYDS